MTATTARLSALAAFAVFAAFSGETASALEGRKAIQEAAARHAAAHGVPMSLVHRVIMRESRYNPRAVAHGNYGLMQIRLATAQGMGYRGPASGLLDTETNLTYAIPYLANAWTLSGGNEARAVQLYASGYYYVAKRQGKLGEMRTAHSAPRRGRPLVNLAAAAQPGAAPAPASTRREVAALPPPAERKAGSPAAAPVAPRTAATAEETPDVSAVARSEPAAPVPPRKPQALVARAIIGAPAKPVTANAAAGSSENAPLALAPTPARPAGVFGGLFRDLSVPAE